MKIIINNEQTKNKPLEYEEDFWTGKRTILYDGTVLTKIKRNIYEYKNGDKTEKFIVKGNQLSGVTISLFNSNVEVARKLTWYEIVLSVLVFIPCVFFGAVGGAIGGALGFTNLTILRRVDNVWIKIIISIEFALLGFLLSYVFAILILNTFTFVFK